MNIMKVGGEVIKMSLVGQICGISQDWNDKKAVISIKLKNNSDLKVIESIFNKDIEIEIKEHKEKRSLSANSYAWVLINLLAEKLNIPAVEVYREYVKDLNVCKQMTLPKEEYSTLKTAWNMLGLGWLVEQLDITSKDEIIANFYYGSSTYNSKQMARLIDNIIQDCKENGIEILPPEELKRMCEQWQTM